MCVALFLLWASLKRLHKFVLVWDGVEERFRKRLAMQNKQFISKLGRIILMRSMLSSMSYAHLLHVFILSKKSYQTKIRVDLKRRPLGWGSLERKSHFVKWATLCSKKERIAWALDIFPLSIRSFCVNEVAFLWKKRDPLEESYRYEVWW